MTKTNNQSSIPRPMNCFLLYRLEKQKEIVAKYAGVNHRDISKIIAQWWKKTTNEEKEPYREKARLAKLEHLKLYPDYKYMPKKKTTPKRVYIRKNKKNDFMSRVSHDSELMNLALPHCQPPQGPVEEMINRDAHVSEIKYMNKPHPQLSECLYRQNVFDCSSPESSYDKHTPLLSPYSESLADQEFFSPMTSYHSIESSTTAYVNSADQQDPAYSILNKPYINSTNAYNPHYNPHYNHDYLPYFDHDASSFSYSDSSKSQPSYPCVNQENLFGSNLLPSYYTDSLNDSYSMFDSNSCDLGFIDPSLLSM
ncbi:hypothetical protein BD560DRAFT_444385 [Blakeslea trispora]|nr:hypothetical protein BD560DRAFT_444385 [Blakeslea trispora]